MTPSWFFASGLGCSVTISILVVLYLRRPLENLRAELCGNQNRAEFWTAFSVVTIGVVPLIFALGYQPTLTAGVPPLLEIAQQLKWALIGMVLSVLMLGWVVGRFLPRPSVKP